MFKQIFTLNGLDFGPKEPGARWFKSNPIYKNISSSCMYKNICTSRRMTQAGCSLRLQFCSTNLGGSTLFFLSTFLHANRFDADELRSIDRPMRCRRLTWIEFIKKSLSVQVDFLHVFGGNVAL